MNRVKEDLFSVLNIWDSLKHAEVHFSKSREIPAEQLRNASLCLPPQLAPPGPGSTANEGTLEECCNHRGREEDVTGCVWFVLQTQRVQKHLNVTIRSSQSIYFTQLHSLCAQSLDAVLSVVFTD